MKYVLDASVAIKWALGEENADKAERIILDGRTGVNELIAPDFFLAECGHGLFKAERNPDRHLVVGDARRLLYVIIADSPLLLPTHGLVPRAAAICQQIRKGFYDCLYVALAEYEQCEFVTADEKLVKAAKPDYPYVVDLATFP